MNNASQEAVRGRIRMFRAMAVLSIAAVCLVAYSNSLSGPFVFDDRSNIQENSSLR